MSVDAAHARLNLRRELVPALEVVGPDGAAEAEVGVVGALLSRQQAKSQGRQHGEATRRSALISGTQGACAPQTTWTWMDKQR